MAKNGFKVFDSDIHLVEPADLWEGVVFYKWSSPLVEHYPFWKRHQCSNHAQGRT